MNVIRDFRTEEPITLEQATKSTPTTSVPNPLYFKLLWFERYGTVYQLKVQMRFNHNLRKSLNLHKCWIDMTITGSHRTLTGDRFLRVLKTQVDREIKKRSSLSINIVTEILNHVLYSTFNFVDSVIQYTSIAMKLY
uniref:Replication enhancer n=1 Tax=Beet curly top virus TaxID=10840 RepID=A0A1J0AIF2_9GEMI|nr:replication enhancer [Beet curly top virus]APB54124.1 replication enhancer [Beet curly top virus]APB54180.1 replication enhancer [Beet curly top virus]WDR24376.1 replication enhancer [Beet curly top virus]WGU24626.1 replication enhancer [Beet curly top virus]